MHCFHRFLNNLREACNFFHFLFFLTGTNFILLVFFVYRSNFGDSSIIWEWCQIKLNSLLLSSKWFSVSIGTISIGCAFNGHLNFLRSILWIASFAWECDLCLWCFYYSRSFRVVISYSKLLVQFIPSILRSGHCSLEWLHCTWCWSYLLTFICSGLCDISFQICQWGAGVIGWSWLC